MKQFEGQVALISGASRGVGFAVAKQLAEQGACIVITARGERRLEEARRELDAMGAEVVAVAGDVADWADAQRMVAAASERFGRLDILVNNAGVSMRGKFADLEPEVCARVIDTNLMGSVYLSRAAVGHLREARGHLVFVSSIAGLIGLPGASTYCASKGALTGLAESLRLELSDDGVHVGVIHLGFTEHDPEKRILAADGSGVAPDRPAHHTQAYAAGLVLKNLAKRKKQTIMTPIGTLGWLLHRLSPRLVEAAILWAGRKQLGIYQRFA